MHWLFLGLLLPYIGIEADVLRSKRYLELDSSAGQLEGQARYSKRVVKTGLGAVIIQVSVMNERVAFLTLSTDLKPSVLERRIGSDKRCELSESGDFLCVVGDKESSVEISVCGRSAVIAGQGEGPEQQASRELCKLLRNDYELESSR